MRMVTMRTSCRPPPRLPGHQSRKTVHLKLVTTSEPDCVGSVRSTIVRMHALVAVRVSRVVQAALAGCLALVLGLALVDGTAASGPCEAAEAVSPQTAHVATGGPVFGFPLDGFPALVDPVMARFCEWSVSPGGAYGGKVHAAEDYQRPPRTPVYAVADGAVSFSGPMGGYGWLIIIDHPESNLYSLYGHLSPSRPRIGTGDVTRGDVIGYLGDDDENGGSADVPLVPHLHFGLRAGQRSDYPGHGEWRWMAGWIEPDPAALGWMVPSRLLAAQQVPAEGFQAPPSALIHKWGPDLILFGIITVATIGWVAFATARRSPLLLIFYGAALFIALHLIGAKGPDMAILVFRIIGVALLAVGVGLMIRRRRIAMRA